MSIGDAIRSVLKADSTLYSLVGEKIYPVAAPQRVQIPFVVYADDGTDEKRSKDGPGNYDVKDFGFDVYAKTYDQAHTISARIRTVINGYSGTSEGIEIDYISISDYSDGPYIEQISAFTVSSNYRIFIKK